ncbi:A24 family peptidase [Nocardia sp. NPDC049220]|uniref:A24 family peptidase n=1 Tax=Nocardia sp. NPDC049220 TaxID=3155273 RepID=UPI0033C55D58
MPPLAFAALTAWCTALTMHDVRERRLPNTLTGPGALAILGYALITRQFTVAALGGALLSAVYLLMHLTAPTALGAGDVKLSAGLGAAAALGGAQAWVWAALGAPALTAGVAVVALVARRVVTPTSAHRSRERIIVPHGPAMCLATLLALLSSSIPGAG